MQKPFYITDGVNKIGPFSKEEVMQMLYSSHISITDFLVDARDNRMCPLLQHEDFGGDGGTHSLTSTGGIAGLTPKSLASKYGFGELRKQIHKEREEKHPAKVNAGSAHLNDVIQARPDLSAKEKPVVAAPVQIIPADDQDTNALALNIEINENYTNKIKANTSTNFFLKVKDKEFGPLKFLILLSLFKQNKISLEAQTRNENEKDWKKLSDYLPAELQKTIRISPIVNTTVLPKSLWKRKNVRLDYEEIVLCHNERYSFVGKSIDLSSEGMAIVWVYDVQVNEEFELSFFDLEKNLITIKATLTRKETLQQQQSTEVPLYKAVFIFKEKIQIKNFIS